MYTRWLAAGLKRDLQKPFVHVLFGARQTGKTTLLDTLIPRPPWLRALEAASSPRAVGDTVEAMRHVHPHGN